MAAIKRGEVYLTRFDISIGSEVGKIRPCVIVSPDQMNQKAATFIVVPLTSKIRPYRSRVDCTFRAKTGQAMLDQIQVMSPLRLISLLGQLGLSDLNRILDRLQEMFAP
jgi:mRNA interferase MazF